MKRPTYAEQMKHHERMQKQRQEPHDLFANDEAIGSGMLIAGVLAVLLIIAAISFSVWVMV